MRVRSAAALLTLALTLAGCATAAPRPAELTDLGVVDAARLIRQKTITSLELTRAYLARDTRRARASSRWPGPSRART